LVRRGVNDLSERHVSVEGELLVPRRERMPEVPALDPAPLHVGQMVDDPDDRKPALVGCPSGLIVGEPLCSHDHQLSLAVQVAQNELAFVVGWDDHS
jgi:hypothetical protein